MKLKLLPIVFLSGCFFGDGPSSKEMCQQLAAPACERLDRCGDLYGLPLTECEELFVPVCERFVEYAEQRPSSDDASECEDVLRSSECRTLHPSCSGFGADRRLPLGYTVPAPGHAGNLGSGLAAGVRVGG